MAISKSTASQLEKLWKLSKYGYKAGKQGGKALRNNLLEDSLKYINFMAFIKCLLRKMRSLEG